MKQSVEETNLYRIIINIRKHKKKKEQITWNLNYYSFFEFNLDLEEKNKKNPETSSITFNNLLQIHIYKGEESAPRERERMKNL